MRIIIANYRYFIAGGPEKYMFKFMDAAEKMGITRQTLNNKLKELGIQFKQSKQWMLKTPYDSWGMHDTRSNIHTSESGKTHTTIYTVWTQRGRRFIIALYENGWDVKRAIKQIKGEMNPAA